MIVSLTLAFGVGLSVVMLVAGISAMRSPATVARGRVRALVESDSPYAAAFESDVRRDRSRRFGRLTAGLGRGASGSTQVALQRSGLPLRVGEWMAIRLGLLSVAGVIGAILGASSMGAAGALLGIVGGAAVGLVGPMLVLKVSSKRRSAAIENQLVELCELMSSMLRGGYGYTQALSTTAEELGNPLGGELARMVDGVRLGADVDEELAALNERLGSTDFEMLVTAISIQRRSGGNLADLIAGVAETIRYRQSFKRELSALTAQSRYSAVIVAGIPVVLIAVLALMDPIRYQLLFTDPVGRIILGISAAMDFFGYLVIKQVSKVEV